VEHCSAWKITASIVISVGLHGLLLTRLDLSLEDQTLSMIEKRQLIEISLVASLSQHLAAQANTEPLHVTEPVAKAREVARRLSPKTLLASEKPIERIKAKEPIPKALILEALKDATKINVYQSKVDPVHGSNADYRAAVAVPSPIKNSRVGPVNPSEILAQDTEPLRSPVTALTVVHKASALSVEAKSAEHVEKNYLASLRAAISDYKYYPIRARRMGKQGNVWVAFFIYRDGRIDQVTIRESSGEPLLDRAARQSVLKLGRYQSFPASLDADFLSVTVTMSYTTHQ